MKKVIIVGAGFAGLSAAKILGGKKDIHLTVIDRRNYHLFQPLLYQVATAGLSPAEIAVPIRSELSRYKNVDVVMSNVTGIDISTKKVITSDSSYNFDYLILSSGAQHSYFGKDQWEEFAPGLKTLEQATEIRRRILDAFEQAEKEVDPVKRKSLLTFVIVGGGPTGVEMAGSIAEISRHTLERDFRHIDPSRTRVILIEAGDRVLGAMDASLSKTATRDLEEMGVQVWTSTRVTNINEGGVYLGDEFISARTVIWAAGVASSPLGAMLGTPLDRIGRVVVNNDLTVPGHDNVFVVGDLASFAIPKGTLPGLAPVAMQQGRHVAHNIVRLSKNKPLNEFIYFDKGAMATIGKSRAVMDFRGIKATGWIAWMAWLFIHIFYLIGFQNKLFVFIRWMWSYLTFGKGARLIMNREWRSDGPRQREILEKTDSGSK
ncbi:MAG: NAD(P)/FAD-dependent oxidoreductase [Bdellovibrionaceae bacterium]|nr:NAD(P)/FAD-dependent oxidoreductase [Pseudobdellovibrionaceae bacterium]